MIGKVKFIRDTYDFHSERFDAIEGLLGYDFLSRFNLYIDLDTEDLYFSKRGAIATFNAIEPSHKIPFQFNDGPPVLTLKLNSFSLMPGVNFDTGSSEGIFLSKVYFNLFKKQVSARKIGKELFRFTDVNGKHQGMYNYILFDSAAVGSLLLKNKKVHFNDDHNIIGLKPFLEYNIGINWDEKEIHLYSRKKVNNRKIQEDR